MRPTRTLPVTSALHQKQGYTTVPDKNQVMFLKSI